MYKGNPSKMARRMVRNIIVQATSLTPTMQCIELVLKCAMHYNPQMNAIQYGKDKKILTVL